ncbi:MAG TPA: Ig-like domain-containing protein [Gemmatimonadales bacterium]|nr:Ig-like domain-containing protein [Gemmatimonadales bacterium]
MKYSHPLSMLALVAAMGACSDGSPLSPGGPTGTAPATQLVTISPQGQATGVDPGRPLTFRFDGAMMPGMEQYVDLHRGDVTGPIHPIACSWSADRTLLTCTPGTPLDPGTHYTLHLGGGMRNSDGTAIQMDPADYLGSWIHGGAAGGMMGGGMTHADDHAGEPWGMMGSGWRHANGTYGIVCPFQTA